MPIPKSSLQTKLRFEVRITYLINISARMNAVGAEISAMFRSAITFY